MKTRFQFGLFSFHGVINLSSYSLSTCEHVKYIMKYTFSSQKTTHSLAAKRSCTEYLMLHLRHGYAPRFRANFHKCSSL